LTWSFDIISNFLSAIGFRKSIIDKLELQFEKAESIGCQVEARRCILSSFSTAVETIDYELGESICSTSAQAYDAEVAADSGESNNSETKHQSLIEAALRCPIECENSFDTFKIWWYTTYVAISPSQKEILETMPRDMINPNTGRMEKNPDWLNARFGRITGSVIGSLLGFGHETADHAMKNFGEKRELNNYERSMMDWDFFNETEAVRVLKFLLNKEMGEVTVSHKGLCVNTSELSLAFSGAVGRAIGSADFMIFTKCPAQKKHRYRNKSEHGKPIYPKHNWPNGSHGYCSSAYWCQVQLGMFVMDLSKCLFFVWTPLESHMQWILRDNDSTNSFDSQRSDFDEFIFTCRGKQRGQVSKRRGIRFVPE
jgi:hypothetical protein